jgi:hypothetical protein
MGNGRGDALGFYILGLQPCPGNIKSTLGNYLIIKMSKDLRYL